MQAKNEVKYQLIWKLLVHMLRHKRLINMEFSRSTVQNNGGKLDLPKSSWKDEF
jgi:hypothetical protein